ncbi:MAG: hypothetical protein U0W24_20675 [Bacteroidales bacterium]
MTMNINPDFKDKRTLEKYSSAYTMSDMEIFVFPELLYPLVIANIMSPIVWKWREDPWFKDIHKKSFNYKVNRIKQYIMDHYVFNLDLDTWGLTTKQQEIDRFSEFIDMDMLRQSNALFGYEGDKYYFDIDIRKHFGLDKYDSDIIPYWKTETIEAMTAFKFRENFATGAGECVSLSTLYAAALFIVGRIPLENIFLIGTPLHSQNFVNINEGLLTNNRRLVTKKMWFNGTSLSTRARRALENEKITIVSHISGFIHHMYKKASINQNDFGAFTSKLREFLQTELSPEVFISFLRFHMDFKKCFQYRHMVHGHIYYIGMETIFEYEHGSKLSFSESTREALMAEIDDEEFNSQPIEDRLVIQEIEHYLIENKVTNIKTMKAHFLENVKLNCCKNEENIMRLFDDLAVFMKTEPNLPSTDKEFEQVESLQINNEMLRDEIMNLVRKNAEENEVAQLALYVYRQMDYVDWRPFIKAAVERNPVILEGLRGKTIDESFEIINAFPGESIYDESRLAQPDEVWNFKRGDGIEKAILLASFILNETNPETLLLNIENEKVDLLYNDKKYEFTSSKELIKNINFKM